MACLAAERGDFPQAEDETDAAWIGAMATLKPSSGLRETILMAMEQTASPVPIPFPSPPRVSIFKKTGIPLGVVQASFVKTYEAPDFDLELKCKDQAALIQNLRERNLPSCENLPLGLVGAMATQSI